MINLETLIITPQILKLIAEIDEFKGEWQQLGRLSPDRLTALKKIATIESIGSSTRIEGAKLSDREIAALLSEVGQAYQSRDEQEVAGYGFLCNEIYENYSSIPLTENAIKQLHTWLLQFSSADERHRGGYKKIPITIEAFNHQGISLGVLFKTTSPLETPFQMEELVNWTRKSLGDNQVHPLLIIGIFVVIFLAIHPFQDGNGRLSRLLTTLLMLKCNYQYVIYSSLESIIEANKESYYSALQKTQKSWQNGEPNWNPWLLFFLQSLQRQKEHLKAKLGKMIPQELPELSRTILKFIRSHSSLSIGDLETLTQSNRNTIKKHLAALARDRYILMTGKGKGSRYIVM